MRVDYPLNSRVSVRITGAIPPGLRGCVGDGQRALIRRREITWGEPLPDETYVGQTHDAVVVGYNTVYDQVELSLRLAERDPWELVPERYPVGKEIVGRVVGLTGRGAFVELEPGVEAFLRLSDLGPLEGDAIEDALWIDDRVWAVVTRLNTSRRRLRLSVDELVQQREAALQKHWWMASQPSAAGYATIAELLSPQTRLQLLRLEDKTVPSMPRLRVLWLEEDGSDAAGVERLLRRNGCQLVQVTGSSQALDTIRDSTAPFDLVVIDWSLPGLDGEQLVHQLQQASPASHLALLVRTSTMGAHPELREALHDIGANLLDRDDETAFAAGLFSVLQELRARQDGVPAPCSPGDPAWFTQPTSRTEPDEHKEMSLLLAERQPTLLSILERLAQETGADTALLLRYSPGRRSVEAVAAAGRPFPLEQASPDLIHSPLKDVLQHEVEVCDRATPRSRKFERLLDIAPFQGFLGVPIPPFGHDAYGLILLKERGGFGRRERVASRPAAYLIAGILQEAHLSQSLLPWQAQHLVGRLVNSAIHEINNKLGAIEFLVQDLQEGLQELARWPEKAQDASLMDDLQQAAERIAAARAEAGALRDQYLSLTASDDVQPVDVCTLAEEMIQVLRAEARRHNVLLAAAQVPDLPPVSAHPSQLRQVFLNLMLNAIQQMANLRRHGRIAIACNQQPETGTLEVRFIDQGPGIHRQLWERVFDFGFTTKKGGAGLGLTISRQVAASLGGRLYVEDSFMGWGTTFLLELPVGGIP